jgi:D-glycero-D-manno-heptose 1,7-bisphosphate phosphatase
MKKRVVFLDKDGVIVDYSLYSEHKIIPTHQILEKEALEGLRYIIDRGYDIIIISNQPWISKNLISKEEVENGFQILIKKLKFHGIEILDYYYCPHQTSDKCYCKKPSPFFIYKAAEKYDINLFESFFVGDSESDIIAGQRAGLKTIRVETGCGKDFSNNTKSDFIIKNLNEIWRII